MSDQVVEGVGEVVELPAEIIFTGWLSYDPRDPASYPWLSIKGERDKAEPYRPDAPPGRRVVPVRVVIPVPAEEQA